MAQNRHWSSRLKQHKPGFGLIEALITLAIVITIASVVTRQMTRDRTQEDLKQISHMFNCIMSTARQESNAKHCAMRLQMYANSMPNKVVLEQETPNPQAPGTYTFVPAAIVGGITSYTLPATWVIKAVYNGPNEQLSEHKNIASCTLAPSGILPSQLIHLNATQKKQGATLKTEPFLKTFTLHNQLIAPPKKVGGKK